MLNMLALARLCVFTLLVSMFHSSLAQEAITDTEQLRRGEYLATAADCEACHTVPRGDRMAGGLPIASPLGTIYSTNITPSKQYGIGNYSLQQFSDALRRGIRADGAHLYPAMPYTSYAQLSDGDIRAMYAYFMNQVSVVDKKLPQSTALSFPYNLRMSMAIWNALFLNVEPFKPDTTMSEEWNRGKYLVTTAAHCGECHTPRGFFMQQDRHREFAGSTLGSWFAPNITPDLEAGIGAMTADEFFRYLKFGKVPGKAQAGGEMALAVELSFSRLRDEDIRAIVAYMRSVSPISEPGTKSKFTQGDAFSDVAEFRGIGGVSSDTALPGGPAQLFVANCASCHGVSANGSHDDYFPSLFHNTALATGAGRNLVATILFGISRSTPNGVAFMPGFGGKAADIAALNNDEVTQLANYLMRHYGNAAYVITPQFVQEVRSGRAPTSSLATLVSIGKWSIAILLFIIAIWFAAKLSGRRAVPSGNSL